MRIIVRRLQRTGWTAACVAGGLCGPDLEMQTPTLTITSLLSGNADERARLIEVTRPTPLPAEQRVRLLAALPRDGEVAVGDTRSTDKLAALRAVLAAARRDDVLVVKVIQLPQAVVAMFERSAVLVSQPALELLTAGELRAIVAHEIGHEYLWDEWHAARSAGDRQSLHDVELVCDLIAITMLQALGDDPGALLRGLARLTHFNQSRFGAADREADHPTIDARRKALARLARSGAR